MHAESAQRPTRLLSRIGNVSPDSGRGSRLTENSTRGGIFAYSMTVQISSLVITDLKEGITGAFRPFQILIEHDAVGRRRRRQIGGKVIRIAVGPVSAARDPVTLLTVRRKQILALVSTAAVRCQRTLLLRGILRNLPPGGIGRDDECRPAIAPSSTRVRAGTPH